MRVLGLRLGRVALPYRWRPRWVGLGAVALIMGVVSRGVGQELPDDLRSVLVGWYDTASRKAPGKWGIAIADQQGRLLWGVNPEEPLVPASTVKLLTTGFARSILGGNARLSTRVVGTGAVDRNGEWLGSWALELNGDPSLERPSGAGPTLSELADQLSQAGIRKLSGPLQVTSADGPATAFYPSVWSPRHRGRLFAPLIGTLTVHENIVWFSVRPGAKVGSRAVLAGAAPEGIASLVTVSATTSSGRRSRLSLRPTSKGGWQVTGRIGVRSRGHRFAAVASDPKMILVGAWGKALRDAGIQWSATTIPAAAPTGSSWQVMAQVTSPSLDSLALDINRRSLNLGAELLLQWAGGRDRGPELLTAHVREITGLNDEVRLVDGSGLSSDDRMSPSAFVSYLARFPTTPAGRNFPLLLPANGVGTLWRLGSGFPSQGVVRAKTGTLSNVSSVVGYLGRADGTLLVSLMYNGSRPGSARQAQWKLFRLLGANGVVIPSDSVEVEEPQLGGERVGGQE